MFKRLSALLWTGFAASSLYAQSPAITSKQFFQLNKDYPYKSAMLLHQSVGPSGAGIVWDFSSIVFPNSTDTTVCIPPAATPAFLSCGISGKDTATICLVNRSFQFFRNDDYHYYLIKAGKIIEVGSDGDNGVVEDVNYQYSRPRIFSLMPFTYGAASVDSFRGTYDSYLTGPHTTRGVDRFEADGYGTLKLAGATYNHCVRIKQASDWADSCAMFGKNARHYACYTWYSTDKEGPVLTMVPDQNTGVVANYYYPRNAPAGVKEVGRGDLFTLYPNPATGQLFLHFKTIPAMPVQLRIFNMLGQVVLNRLLSGQDNLIDVSLLANGAYSCQAGDPDSRQSSATFIKR